MADQDLDELNPETPLNPGITRTVAWLRSFGFKTSDSGDGQTHDFECDHDNAYVVIVTKPEELVAKTEELVGHLIKRGLKIRPNGMAHLEEVSRPDWVEIQSSYDPGDKSAVIYVAHIRDDMLPPEVA
jgi:Ser-tRNA(Ala) deacylase AlaX